MATNEEARQAVDAYENARETKTAAEKAFLLDPTPDNKEAKDEATLAEQEARTKSRRLLGGS